MIIGAIVVAMAFLSMAAPGSAEEQDVFVFAVEGLVCEESSHAVEEALESLTRISFVEVDLSEKLVTVEAAAGSYQAGELIQAINAAEDSQGSMKATLKKNPAKRDTTKPEK